MNILLVEPTYKRKYPPLGLMKISTWHKNKGDTVFYLHGDSWIDLDFNPDIIYVTSLFTWDLPQVIQVINSFKKRFSTAEIKVGGVAATAMPDKIKKETGISPHVGVIPEVDSCVPDYTMSKETKELEESLGFTTRGCPWKCRYCVVRILEPRYYEIDGWARCIDSSKPRITLFDNNIVRASKRHFNSVIRLLEEQDKQVDFNSGFDCKLLTKDHVEQIAKIHVHPIRLAFDKLEQEKPLIKSVNLFKEKGISTDNIRVYVLYNYYDDLEEAKYRADKVIELGCKPFVMRYKPLDWLKKEMYVSPNWTKEDIVNFTYYYNMPTVWKTISFEQFLKERDRGEFEKLRKKSNLKK
jgi:hypothetical protein